MRSYIKILGHEVRYAARYLISAFLGLLPFWTWYPAYRAMQWKLGGLRTWNIARHLGRFASAYAHLPILKKPNDFCFFEIGSGGTLFHPLLAFAAGFKEVHTSDRVDIRDHRLILQSLQFILTYREMIEETLTAAAGSHVNLDSERLRTLEAISRSWPNAELPVTFHETPSLESTQCYFNLIRSRERTLIFTSDVLEHVTPDTLNQFSILLENNHSRRVLMYHFVDFSDHFATGHISRYRFRRFPGWLWSLTCGNRYHFCNRLPVEFYLSLFATHGIIDTRLNDTLALLEVWCDSEQQH